jgi:hypothetical protein
LDEERSVLFPILTKLSPEEADAIAVDLQAARARALVHPLPPHNPFARWLNKVAERVDGLAHDTSTQYRPADHYLNR